MYIRIKCNSGLLLAAAAAATLAGCGGSAYESKFDKTLNIQKQAQAFVALEGERRTIPGTSLGVRLPKPLKDQWKALTGDDANRGKVSLLAELPEVVAYESWGPYSEQSKRGDINMFVHLGSIPLNTPDAKYATMAQVEEAILERAAKGSTNHGPLTPGARADQTVETPPVAGGAQPPLHWRRIQLEGQTNFERKPQHERDIHPGMEDSVIELWLHGTPHDNPENVVVILWRAPHALAARLPGKGDDAPEDPLFDVTKFSPLTAGTLQQVDN